MTPTLASKTKAKILTDEASLQQLVDDSRANQRRIVLTQGTFDLVHIGHARYCQKAKSYGDVLIVGVDSDAKVRARKGPDRPVVPESERLEMLTYLDSVDGVVLKPLEAGKWQLIKTIRPDVLVATKQTYTDSELKQLEKLCGRIVVLDPMATTSTSAKIRRLQIGMAKKIAETLSQKLIITIEKTLEELRQI
jgi:rfaE bifunctional protein nucleotidyltransferase chain/domain